MVSTCLKTRHHASINKYQIFGFYVVIESGFQKNHMDQLLFVNCVAKDLS